MFVCLSFLCVVYAADSNIRVLCVFVFVTFSSYLYVYMCGCGGAFVRLCLS